MTPDAPQETPGGTVSAARWFGTTLSAGLLAGVLLSLLEAIERGVTLRHSLGGFAERLDLAVHSALIAPATALLSLVLATAGLAAMRLSMATRRSFRGEGSRLTGVVAIAALVIPLVMLAATPLARGAVQRLAYLLQLDKAGEHAVLYYLLPLAFVVPMVLAAPAAANLLQGRLTGRWGAFIVGGFVVLAITSYYVDSRWLVGLTDTTAHQTLSLATMTAAVVACFVPATRLASSARVRLLLTTACLVFLVAGSSLALLRLNQNPRVSALFWTRGVISQRAATIAEWVLDGDGDNFAALLGGGDGDDHEVTVHPLARDIPGDGVDQNGLGGDASAALDVTTPAYFAAGQPAPGVGRRNVILITIDTLRADHLSGYGYHRPTTPEIDAFAGGGVTFLNAEAQATSTGHSFASMMTGAYGDRVFASDQPRLGALLAASGYATPFTNSAPSRRFINRDDTWLYYRELMSTGFQPRDADEPHFRRAAELVDDTIGVLKSLPTGQPLFLWFHLRDPHAGYTRHPDFDFGARAIDRYDSEIAYTDHHLGRFFRYLQEHGWLEDSLVIITSDHGESFGEHGDYSHHRRPYRSLAHVPLIVRWPGAPSLRLEHAAGTLDIAPTVANWAGLGGAAARFDGIDLRWQAGCTEGELADRAVVCETPRNCNEASFLAWSLRQGRYRLVYDVMGPRTELFDVAADPRESRNLAAELPDVTAHMLEVLGHYLDRMSNREGFTGWAQMLPSMWCPAPRFAELPVHPDRRKRGEATDE
jgi:arylsulfatase A-like enzyme